MDPTTKISESRLLAALREGICVMQMVLYKELRALLGSKYPSRDPQLLAMLTGALTNELFGTLNREEKFINFHHHNQADIEQELLSLARELPHLMAPLTDALRMQALCDSRGEEDSVKILKQAADIGLLLPDRAMPMPSSFLIMMRNLGNEHQLVMAPAQLSPEDEQGLVH